MVGSMFAMFNFGKADYFVFLIIFLINSKCYYMFGLISLVFCQFSYWFQFGSGQLFYSTSFVNLSKILLDHSSLVCFWFLLYSVFHFLNLLLVSFALSPDMFGCWW